MGVGYQSVTTTKKMNTSHGNGKTKQETRISHDFDLVVIITKKSKFEIACIHNTHRIDLVGVFWKKKKTNWVGCR